MAARKKVVEIEEFLEEAQTADLRKVPAEDAGKSVRKKSVRALRGEVAGDGSASKEHCAAAGDDGLKECSPVSAVADAKEIMAYYTAVMRGEVVEHVPMFVGQGVQQMVRNSPKISDRTAAAEKLARLLGADKGPEERDAPRIIDVRPET